MYICNIHIYIYIQYANAVELLQHFVGAEHSEPWELPHVCTFRMCRMLFQHNTVLGTTDNLILILSQVPRPLQHHPVLPNSRNTAPNTKLNIPI